MFAILVAVLIISFFDLRNIIREKQPRVLAVYLVLAIVTLAYGYYYSTHLYTASIVKGFIKLFNIQ